MRSPRLTVKSRTSCDRSARRERISSTCGLVASPLTLRAADEDVAEELHLDLLEAVAPTALAAAGAGVERKVPAVSPRGLGVSVSGEKLADHARTHRRRRRASSAGCAKAGTGRPSPRWAIFSCPCDRPAPPGFLSGRLSRAAGAGSRRAPCAPGSLLPEPETPVTQQKTPSGIVDVDMLAGCSGDAPRSRIRLPRFALRRFAGTGIDFRAAQVVGGQRVCVCRAACSSGPLIDEFAAAPPRALDRCRSGDPRARMTASSCSTTSSVLPLSRRPSMTSMSRPVSRGCRPMLARRGRRAC